MAAFHVMAAGCGGMIHRGTLGPTDCAGEPTIAGLWYSAHGRAGAAGARLRRARRPADNAAADAPPRPARAEPPP